jgi:hypothetical protein
MKLRSTVAAGTAVLTLAVTIAATLVQPAHAQTTTPAAGVPLNAETGSPKGRSQLKMDTQEFRRTHHWDEQSDTWMLNAGVDPPAGVTSRADVKAQRNLFLSNNRWDNANSQYLPVKPGPRDLSTLSRAQVKAETIQFMRTHSWDEEQSAWVAVPLRNSKM